MKKKIFSVLFIFSLIFLIVPINVYSETNELEIQQATYINSFEKISLEENKKSIVSINNNEIYLGTGFIVEINEENIYVATNFKITHMYESFELMFGNTRLEGEVMYKNETENLAFIKVENKNLPNIQVATYGLAKSTSMGQDVQIYSFNTTNNLTIISGNIAKTNVFNENSFHNLITTKSELMINGKLVYNELGHLLGMITKNTTVEEKYLIQGMNYYISVEQILKMFNQIKIRKKFEKNKLGFDIISLGELSLKERRYYEVNKKVNKGAVITSFDPIKYIFGGLNLGMVIQSINGIEVNDASDVIFELNRYNKNDKINIEVINRYGKIKNYQIKIK